jgi:hypothetical protein
VTTATLWYEKLSVWVSSHVGEGGYSLPHWSCWEGAWPAFQLPPQSYVSGAHLRLRPATLYQLGSLPQEPFLYPNSDPNLFLSNPPSDDTHTHKGKGMKWAYKQIDVTLNSPSLPRKGWLQLSNFIKSCFGMGSQQNIERMLPEQIWSRRVCTFLQRNSSSLILEVIKIIFRSSFRTSQKTFNFFFYFWELHPVAFVTKTSIWWPWITTKIFISSISLTSLHVSIRAGHLQENTIVFLEASYCL